ncbi:MAG: DUF6328 family protein [Acidobacteriota bacterium]|nr:DUF6328 family protein [Acidobacteriota bacterium]
MTNPVESKTKSEALPLPEAVEQLLEEARMVLPGMQALFGFQLIAVFNDGFSKHLPETLQRVHLVAIALTCVAVALVMTPAAYHRQTSPRAVSEDFLRLSTRLLVGSMFPLAASIAAEVYLVGFVVLKTPWAGAIAGGVFVMFLGLWFLLPMLRTSAGRNRERED